MGIKKEKSLEKRAKELLRWKITGEGRIPNFFYEKEKILEELKFLIDKGYIIERGETPKSLRYGVAPEGKNYFLE